MNSFFTFLKEMFGPVRRFKMADIGSPYHSHKRKPVAGDNGMVVALPWVFENGNPDSRSTAIATAEEIGRRAGFALISSDVAEAAWSTRELAAPSFAHPPTKADLKTFGRALNARKVMFGSVSWRSSTGQGAASTATVSVHVFDVPSSKVVFTRSNIVGRSNESAADGKIADDILHVPLIPANSNGSTTPQEQRAVQVALSLAFNDWARPTLGLH
jgi:hypothetical protein